MFYAIDDMYKRLPLRCQDSDRKFYIDGTQRDLVYEEGFDEMFVPKYATIEEPLIRNDKERIFRVDFSFLEKQKFLKNAETVVAEETKNRNLILFDNCVTFAQLENAEKVIAKETDERNLILSDSCVAFAKLKKEKLKTTKEVIYFLNKQEKLRKKKENRFKEEQRKLRKDLLEEFESISNSIFYDFLFSLNKVMDDHLEKVAIFHANAKKNQEIKIKRDKVLKNLLRKYPGSKIVNNNIDLDAWRADAKFIIELQYLHSGYLTGLFTAEAGKVANRIQDFSRKFANVSADELVDLIDDKEFIKSCEELMLDAATNRVCVGCPRGPLDDRELEHLDQLLSFDPVIGTSYYKEFPVCPLNNLGDHWDFLRLLTSYIADALSDDNTNFSPGTCSRINDMIVMAHKCWKNKIAMYVKQTNKAIHVCGHYNIIKVDAD